MLHFPKERAFKSVQFYLNSAKSQQQLPVGALYRNVKSL